MFEPTITPGPRRRTLAALETLLALVEGWVDTVVAEAVGDRLPGAAALQETLRRRRATGGPAEQTFATLIGLELRPRRLRAAADLWRNLESSRGIEGRDALWAHPDLLPSSSDLDDPAGIRRPRQASSPTAAWQGLGDFELDDARRRYDETAPRPTTRRRGRFDRRPTRMAGPRRRTKPRRPPTDRWSDALDAPPEVDARLDGVLVDDGAAPRR